MSSLLEETLQNNTESDDDDEELKLIQAQKVSRLESSTKIYKTEIRRLTQKVIELEEQILTLEHKNGRLIMDSNQNVSLKGKIQKLQEGNVLFLPQFYLILPKLLHSNILSHWLALTLSRAPEEDFKKYLRNYF